ncbi:core histone macro-H2A.1 [Trichonephila clavipes]|nr:core histone macro-H2A.1 [Trichonephila clavipes]
MNVLNVMSEWDYTNKSAVLDGDFEWVCSTITSQNIYGRTPMILLTMRPSRLFVKIRCHAVASTRKRSAVRKSQMADISSSWESKYSREPLVDYNDMSFQKEVASICTLHFLPKGINTGTRTY